MIKHRCNISIFLLIILFLCAGSIKTTAQEKQYMFKRLTKENGLSNNRINSFLLDSKGFLWIGTANGLNRYDGYSIKNYKANPNDSSLLQNSIIGPLAEDYENNIWVSDGDYLNIYNPRENIFHHKDSIFNGQLKFEIETRWLLKKDMYGNYWYSSSKQGLYKYKVKNDSLIQVLGINKSLINQQRHQLTGFDDDLNGNIWSINAFGKIYKIDNTSCKILDSVQLDLGDAMCFMNILVDSDGDLWCYDSNSNFKGIFWVNAKTKQVKHLTRDSKFMSLGSNIVRCIVEDTDRKIWIGNDHGGINIIDKKENTIQQLLTNPLNDKSLAENTINVLYADYNGFIWAGSFKKGVSYYHNDLFKFNHYKIDIPGDNSATINDIDNFVEDKKGNLWIGTNGSGIMYFNRTDNTFKQYKHNPNNPNSISADVIIGLAADKDDNIWIGTYFGGLNKWDGKHFTHYMSNPANAKTLTDDRIWDICDASDGKLWIATLLGGVNVFDPVKGQVVEVFQSIDGNTIKSNVVLTIIEDRSKIMWFATFDGLRSYSRETKTFEYYNHNSDDESSLSDNSVFDICEDSRGYIWVATSNGLNVLNKATKKFIRLFESDGLPDNRIITVVEDENHSIWLSTSNGLANIIVDNESSDGIPRFKITNYDNSDGLQGKEFNEKAAYKTSKGELLFGGSNGFNLFHPNEIVPKNYESNIVFTDFLLFNESCTNHKKLDGSVCFKNDISYTQNITLKYNENLFTIEFANLIFFQQERKKFQYQMLGFNEGWLETSANNRRITYTNLDAGTYTFSVKVSNSDGSWNPKIASLNITILPPWWLTWWFKVISVFAILLVVTSFIYWRLYQLRKQKKLLTVKVEERTKELSLLNNILNERQEEITLQNDELNLHRDKLEHLVEERTIDLGKALKKAEESDRLKSAFLANMSHEIRTPMNAIVGFSHLISDQELDATHRNKYIDIIHKNCDSLMVLIDDILDISKIEANQIDIKKERFDIILLFDEIYSYYKLKSEYSLDIIYERPKDLINLMVNSDAVRIQQVVQNLLNNALKFTEHGYVKFGFNVAHNNLTIYVEDTGIGIEFSDTDEVFRMFGKIEQQKVKLYRGAGLGLAICKRISELMGGDISFESEVGKGTRFSFSIPVEILG